MCMMCMMLVMIGVGIVAFLRYHGVAQCFAQHQYIRCVNKWKYMFSTIAGIRPFNE